MKLSTLSIIELLLFNLAIIFVFQPRFIFSALRIKANREELFRSIFTGLGILTIFMLFAWSFYFGAVLFLFKRSMLG